MIAHGKSIKIFSANSNVELAREIAKYVGVPMGSAEVTKFSDGEISMNIYETVRGSDVFVVQSTCSPVNTHLMELLIMIDAFKRASAAQITAVIPYYGYARQDRKIKARDPITAKLVADLLTTAGAHRVLTMDLHAGQIQGFFNIPVDNLFSMPLLARYYIDKGFSGEDTVVVSPDLGSVTRARNFANKLNASLAIIDKRRPRANVAMVMNIIGDVKGKRAILIDDLIDTAGTIQQGANALVERGGAREVYACAAHAVLSGPAIERIIDSPVKELLVTNSIPLPPEKQIDKIRVLSVAPLFGEAIERIYEGLPVSILFD
ncbi:MAG: ribose-phosphate diphosphokinase [Caldicoprobacterales bacterium]|jgi:ribose-phosphate pyrophosphokinase|nr:ribose-phosphate pyrophosphokinase [Clostridiales bacterium]